MLQIVIDGKDVEAGEPKEIVGYLKEIVKHAKRPVEILGVAHSISWGLKSHGARAFTTSRFHSRMALFLASVTSEHD